MLKIKKMRFLTAAPLGKCISKFKTPSERSERGKNSGFLHINDILESKSRDSRVFSRKSREK